MSLTADVPDGQFAALCQLPDVGIGVAVGVGCIVAVGDDVRVGDCVPHAARSIPNIASPTQTIPAGRLAITCTPSLVSVAPLSA